MKVKVTHKNYLEAPIGAILEVELIKDGSCPDYYEVSGQELLRADVPNIADDDYMYLLEKDTAQEV